MKSIKASSCLLALALGLPLLANASVKIPSLGAADGADIRIASYYEGTDLKGRQVDLPQVMAAYPFRSESFQKVAREAARITVTGAVLAKARQAANQLAELVQEIRGAHQKEELERAMGRMVNFDQDYLLILVAVYYEAGYVGTPGDELASLMLPGVTPRGGKASNLHVLGLYMYAKALLKDRARDFNRRNA